MNPSNPVLCIGCSKPFSRSNLLRVAECSRTYCESCLTTIAYCRVDQKPNNTSVKGETLPMNSTISNKIGMKEKELPKQICLLHDKQIDLVCVDDEVGICTNCALFGQHKNHNIKTTDSVVQECTAMAEQTIAILGQVEELENAVSVKSLDNKIELAFKGKKQMLTKQIKAKFHKIIDSIKNTEKTCLLELQEIVEKEKKALKEMIVKSAEEEKKRGWIKQAQKLIHLVDLVKVDQAARYLNTNHPESGLIKRGEYLILQLNTFQSTVTDKLSESLGGIWFEMDSSVFDKILLDCYKLERLKGQISVLKTQRQDDEFLLEQQQVYPITPTPSTVEKQRIEDSASSMCVDIPQLAIEKMGVSVHSFVEKSQRKAVDRSMIKQPLGVSNLDNRKKKKMKIPEKYEAAFDDLKNDRCDCLDFTNAELGDATVVQLTEYIKNSSKLRTIKLIRNKLTDECLVPLLQACGESRVTSLNLGQNSFTEKALEIVQRMEVKELRSITLSQNKLNPRSSKGKMAQLKKKGLTISI